MTLYYFFIFRDFYEYIPDKIHRSLLILEHISMNMEKPKWQKFFEDNPKPKDFDVICDKIREFCVYHHSKGSKVALVTSGGTSVPLEQNTVRFIDNFSAGTRGSASAEKFIDKDYAVIFLYRNNTLRPFMRHFRGFLDFLEIIPESSNQNAIQVKSEQRDKLMPLIKAYQEAVTLNKIHFVKYNTLTDYLFLLKELAVNLSLFGPKAIMYLAAAVSDFYIPLEDMPEHKIQSSNGPLTFKMELVPKILAPLVKHWSPDAFIISFKILLSPMESIRIPCLLQLETDENLLLKKSKLALQNYGHHLVIANILMTRKEVVWLVENESTSQILMTKEEMNNGSEIEEKIINQVSELHEKFISSDL